MLKVIVVSPLGIVEVVPLFVGECLAVATIAHVGIATGRKCCLPCRLLVLFLELLDGGTRTVLGRPCRE